MTVTGILPQFNALLAEAGVTLSQAAVLAPIATAGTQSADPTESLARLIQGKSAEFPPPASVEAVGTQTPGGEIAIEGKRYPFTGRADGDLLRIFFDLFFANAQAPEERAFLRMYMGGLEVFAPVRDEEEGGLTIVPLVQNVRYQLLAAHLGRVSRELLLYRACGDNPIWRRTLWRMIGIHESYTEQAFHLRYVGEGGDLRNLRPYAPSFVAAGEPWTVHPAAPELKPPLIDPAASRLMRSYLRGVSLLTMGEDRLGDRLAQNLLFERLRRGGEGVVTVRDYLLKLAEEAGMLLGRLFRKRWSHPYLTMPAPLVTDLGEGGEAAFISRFDLPDDQNQLVRDQESVVGHLFKIAGRLRGIPGGEGIGWEEIGGRLQRSFARGLGSLEGYRAGAARAGPSFSSLWTGEADSERPLWTHAAIDRPPLFPRTFSEEELVRLWGLVDALRPYLERYPDRMKAHNDSVVLQDTQYFQLRGEVSAQDRYLEGWRLVQKWLAEGRRLNRERPMELYRTVSGEVGGFERALAHVVRLTNSPLPVNQPMIPVSRIGEALDRLFAWYEAAGDLHPIERAMILNQRVIEIHPAANANGRTGLLLQYFEMARAGLPLPRQTMELPAYQLVTADLIGYTTLLVLEAIYDILNPLG